MGNKLKIAFTALHPGSANTLTDIISTLREEGHEVYCYPLNEYIRDMWDSNEVYEDNLELFNRVPTDLDYFVYSPEASTVVDQNVCYFCQEHGITSVATIDIFWLTKANLIERFPVFPDFIITPEQTVVTMLEEIGATSKVLNLGNPYFKSRSRVDKISKIETISLVSAPDCNGFNCDTQARLLGIFMELLEIVREIPTVKKIYICPHPRETRGSYNNILNNYNFGDIEVKFNDIGSTYDCCNIVDVVVGDCSTALFEQVLNNKAVYFYETKEDMKHSLLNLDLYKIPYDFELPENALESIISFLKEGKR